MPQVAAVTVWPDGGRKAVGGRGPPTWDEFVIMGHVWRSYTETLVF